MSVHRRTHRKSRRMMLSYIMGHVAVILMSSAKTTSHRSSRSKNIQHTRPMMAASLDHQYHAVPTPNVPTRRFTQR
eukprot:8741367-Heterocapsa_arctica.AAC.1